MSFFASISNAKLEADMDCMSVKWLLLETPVPEEQLVAALRLRRGPDQAGCIDILCAAGDAAVQECMLRRLLLIAETVSFNLGLKKTIVQVPEWREDLELLLKSLSYRQLSGCAWPQEKQHQLSKPTMLLDYHKTLSSAPDNNSTAQASTSFDGIAVIEEEEEALQVVEHFSRSEISTMNPDDDDSMERLMESLFTALYVEYGPGDGKRS